MKLEITPAGSGGITGTGTDTHIVRWNGTTNIQDSGWVIATTTDIMSISKSDASAAVIDVTNSATTAAVAIRGTASGATGVNIGVHGVNTGTSNFSNAIYGDQQGTSGQTIGVGGRVASTTDGAVGVWGNSIGTTGKTYGVYASNVSTSTSSGAILGDNQATSGAVIGIWGQIASTSDGAVAVFGNAQGTTGVNYAGIFQNASATDGATGAYGHATAGSGVTYGLHGATNSTTTNAAAVFGEASGGTGQTFAVYGVASSTSGIAVLGSATAATGVTYGGYFAISSSAATAYSVRSNNQTYVGSYADWAEGAAPTNAGATVGVSSLWIDASHYIHESVSSIIITPVRVAGLVVAAGTTGLEPILLNSGTNLTNAAAGAFEYDGVQQYETIDTTSGRGAVPVEQYFHLTATGSAITNLAGISNFFGASSNINIVSGAYYIIDIHCWFQNSTAGAVTWTYTNSAAPTSQNIYYEMSPITTMVAPPGTATNLVGQVQGDTTAAKTIITGSISNLAIIYCHTKIWLDNATGTTLKIQATKGTGGSITPLRGSYWHCRRISPNNVGTFAA